MQLDIPCMSSELVEGGAELLRIETFYRPPGQSEGGVRVVIHVSPQDALGHYSITLTRLEGDTFAYHALFRLLKSRLADVTSTLTDGAGAAMPLAAMPLAAMPLAALPPPRAHPALARPAPID